jgi:hypothetical protein
LAIIFWSSIDSTVLRAFILLLHILLPMLWWKVAVYFNLGGNQGWRGGINFRSSGRAKELDSYFLCCKRFDLILNRENIMINLREKTLRFQWFIGMTEKSPGYHSKKL